MKNPAPSPFVESALELEKAFREVEELAGSLHRHEFNSESSYEKARTLLLKFSERSQTLGNFLLALGQQLQERRETVERAVELVHQRMPEIQSQFLAAEAVADRFAGLGDKVRHLTQSAPQLPLDKVDEGLQALTEEVQDLREQARGLKLRGMEKKAEDLAGSLKELARQLRR